jgi:transglutaminase-like putative cysteine protease
VRTATLLLLALLAAPALSGCLQGLGSKLARHPDYAVSRTEVQTGPGTWNTEGTFTVQVNQVEPVLVSIEAEPVPSGVARSIDGLANDTLQVVLAIPDGTWTIRYSVGGYAWETFTAARFDSTPPTILGLQTLGDAPDGRYTLGSDAQAEPGASVRVVDQSDGTVVGTELPVDLSGLAAGVHAYDIVVTDPAGNEAVWVVQVLAGSATQLPAGQFTFGIVARYTTTTKLWDLTDLTRYLSPAAAGAEAPDELGSGVGVKPNDPDVRNVVAQTVKPSMTTAEAALALYKWMFNTLEYNQSRLDSTDLLDPAQTMAAGGGVCRDLAALYVSLLRADGVPARLVAGYLSGKNVEGFHAWVEFYGGAGHGPSAWVPVDVSGIDGSYSDAAMLQSFAVRLPEHLMLRAITPTQEQSDWSNAATLSYSVSGQGAPVAPFSKQVTDVGRPVTAALCINEQTHFRSLVSDASRCTTPRKSHIEGFISSAIRVLDYGIDVQSAQKGTTLRLELVYPDLQGNTADKVESVYYYPPPSSGFQSTPFHEDAVQGRATGEVRR